MVTAIMLLSLSVGVGALSHMALYIRGEWHLQAPLLVQVYTLLVLVGVSIRVCLGNSLASSSGLPASSLQAMPQDSSPE